MLDGYIANPINRNDEFLFDNCIKRIKYKMSAHNLPPGRQEWFEFK